MTHHKNNKPTKRKLSKREGAKRKILNRSRVSLISGRIVNRVGYGQGIGNRSFGEDHPKQEAAFTMDMEVMVRNEGGEWLRRHWAGVNAAGKTLCWFAQRTSWTTTDTRAFDECRLPTKDEMR